MFYYNGYEYYKILDKELEMEAARYSEGHWEDADMYITDRRVDFPYWEYCIPGKIWDEFFTGRYGTNILNACRAESICILCQSGCKGRDAIRREVWRRI